MPVRSTRAASPMLATASATLPVGPDWTYEVKWDGYRALAIKDGTRVKLASRNDKDLTRDFPALARAVAALPIERGVLDGEIVALDGEGRPSFQALQHRPLDGHVVVFYAFELLSAAGRYWLNEPVAERRVVLVSVLQRASAVSTFEASTVLLS